MVPQDTSHASTATLHAVGAFIRIGRGNRPRIGGIHLPIEQAEVASFERLNDFLTRQTAAPRYFHVRSIDICRVGIILGDNRANRIEVLIQHVINRACRLVVVDGDRVALDRLGDGLITFLLGEIPVGTP